MKREIKFRAWDKIDKVIRVVTCVNFFDETVNLDEKPNGDCITRKIEDVELLQFTGIKDKNDIEVYEGDILTHPGINNIFFDATHATVIFEQASFRGVVKEGMRPDLYNFFQGEDSAVVIGNIYENPNLM